MLCSLPSLLWFDLEVIERICVVRLDLEAVEICVNCLSQQDLVWTFGFNASAAGGVYYIGNTGADNTEVCSAFVTALFGPEPARSSFSTSLAWWASFTIVCSESRMFFKVTTAPSQAHVSGSAY